MEIGEELFAQTLNKCQFLNVKNWHFFTDKTEEISHCQVYYF